MSNLLPLTPEGVADQALQAEADRLHSSGELAVNAWTANARPASGWNLQGFMEYRRQAAASVPQFPGAQASTGWLDTAKKFVPEHEGNESFAYHGILSAPRKAGQKYVTPGHGSKEEVSVGYGFNLQRRDARNVFKQQLGLSDTDFDDVYNGRRGVTPAESEKLLTYALYEANAQIDHKLRGVPLRDHQRAALVSLVYNAGIGSVEGSGLLEAVRHGNEGEAAGRILAFNTMGGALDGRRKSEASLFLGARAEEYFDVRRRQAAWLKAANARAQPIPNPIESAIDAAAALWRRETVVGAVTRMLQIDAGTTKPQLERKEWEDALESRLVAHLKTNPELRRNKDVLGSWLYKDLQKLREERGVGQQPAFREAPR